MSKFCRFGGLGSCHQGYAVGPTVAQVDRLNTLLPEFKRWFASLSGFGEYLRTFFAHYRAYFEGRSATEEHALAYTQIHQEFSAQLEEAIVGWLRGQGLSEDDFGDMMRQANARGDQKSDEIVGVLLGMMDYQLWISSIFALQQSSCVTGLLGATAGPGASAAPAAEPAPTAPLAAPAAPAEAQLLSVTVPEGLVPGQQLQVTSPDGQQLLATVPEGVAAGQVMQVAYVPLQAA